MLELKPKSIRRIINPNQQLGQVVNPPGPAQKSYETTSPQEIQTLSLKRTTGNENS